MSRRAFWLALLIYLFLRIWMGTVTGDQDSQYYQGWAYQLATTGIAAAYDNPQLDYPPLVTYIFYPIGKVYKHFVPKYRPAKLHRSRPFVLLIKTPHLVFDFLCAVLIYGLIAGRGLWGGARAGPGWGRLAALLYLYNPAVIWSSGYWGQLDSVHTFFGMAAIAALAFQRVSFSGVLLAASGLMKPLAAPLAPVIGVSMLARKGVGAFARGAGSGVICALVILLPFLVTGRGWDVVERIVRDLDRMAYTSMNAHTLWMLVGPWRASNEAIVAGVTPQTIGLLLFVIAIGLLLFRSWSWLESQELGDADYLARLVVLAAAAYSSFYFFSTNMHENHLFLAAPLLLLVAGRSRAFAWLAAGCAVATWLNMMIHDLDLPYLLPWPLSARSPLLDPYLVYDSPRNMTRHAYGEDLHFTWLQLVGIAGNMLLVMWVCGFTYLKAWRGRGE